MAGVLRLRSDGRGTPPALLPVREWSQLPNATIFTAMGINPKTAYEVEKRPFYATKDGIGKPANGIFA